MTVRVTIGRLVLDGVRVRPAHRPALAAAMEAELARLIAAGGVPAGWTGGVGPAVARGRLALPADGDPAALGRGIARAVYAEEGP